MFLWAQNHKWIALDRNWNRRILVVGGYLASVIDCIMTIRWPTFFVDCAIMLWTKNMNKKSLWPWSQMPLKPSFKFHIILHIITQLMCNINFELFKNLPLEDSFPPVWAVSFLLSLVWRMLAIRGPLFLRSNLFWTQDYSIIQKIQESERRFVHHKTE